MHVCSCVNEDTRANIFCRLFEYFICPVWRLIVLRSHCVYSRVQTELESSLAFLLLSLFDSCVFVCVCVSLCVRESGKKIRVKREGKIWCFTWWPHTYPGPSSRSSWRGQAAIRAGQTHSSNSLPGSWFACTHFPLKSRKGEGSELQPLSNSFIPKSAQNDYHLY